MGDKGTDAKVAGVLRLAKQVSDQRRQHGLARERLQRAQESIRRKGDFVFAGVPSIDAVKPKF